MDNTIIALQNLYVAMGGALTDTYEDISDGASVANLVTIPDMINAIAELKAGQAAKETEETDSSGE